MQTTTTSVRQSPLLLGRSLAWASLLATSLLAASLAGCAPSSEELLTADASRGALSEDGPYGALLERTSLRVRVDQTVATDLYLPLDGDELAEGSFPPVVLVQGGLVATDRYKKIGAHIASRGFVVISPSHTGNLALFDAGTTLDALFAAKRASATGAGVLTDRIADVPGLILGHSLGGVVASKTWLAAPDDLSHLVLLASVPDESDALSVRDRGTVLSMVGSADGRIDVDTVREGAALFETDDVVVAAIDGMNHFQFVDDPTEQELSTDGASTVPDNVARTRFQYLLDAALDEVLGRDDEVLDAPDLWPLGVDPVPLSGDAGAEAAMNDDGEGA